MDVNIWFQFSRTIYERQEQVYTYGRSSFLADLGGYLGLLLGFSCFTLYEITRGACSKFAKTGKAHPVV